MKLKVDSTLTARLGQVGGGLRIIMIGYAVSISAGALSIRFESNPDLSVGLFLLGPIAQLN